MWTPAEIYGDKDMIYDLFEEMILFLEFDFKYEQTCSSNHTQYSKKLIFNLFNLMAKGQTTGCK